MTPFFRDDVKKTDRTGITAPEYFFEHIGGFTYAPLTVTICSSGAPTGNYRSL